MKHNEVSRTRDDYLIAALKDELPKGRITLAGNWTQWHEGSERKFVVPMPYRKWRTWVAKQNRKARLANARCEGEQDE